MVCITYSYNSINMFSYAFARYSVSVAIYISNAVSNVPSIWTDILEAQI
jgi:hypothetical protein